MDRRGLRFVDDVTPALLREFVAYLRAERQVKAATANDYLDAVHNFFRYVIRKRKLHPGPNPAATGRDEELDRLSEDEDSVPCPDISPNHINPIIEVARNHRDWQIMNLIVFFCEGGFRFQDVQFLTVGDICLENRLIEVDRKVVDVSRVRPELRKRCLEPGGIWRPKTQASRRPVRPYHRPLGAYDRRDGPRRTLGLGIRELRRETDRGEQNACAAEEVRPGGGHLRRAAPENGRALVGGPVALAPPLPPHADLRISYLARGVETRDGTRFGRGP
jgi:integrase